MESEDCKIIQFPRRSVERINGIAIDLGRIATDELILLERQCAERYQDAQLEMLIVQDYLGKRIRGGDDAS